MVWSRALMPGTQEGTPLAYGGVLHLAGLGQRMGAHPKHQHLVSLAGAVDADVGAGRRQQQAAQGVERFRADHRAVDRGRVRGGPRGPRRK